eukprot:6954884-Prorocentrum_lima.AAC.1
MHNPASFAGKGIYPLNACDWWLSAADTRVLTKDGGFQSNAKKNIIGIALVAVRNTVQAGTLPIASRSSFLR